MSDTESSLSVGGLTGDNSASSADESGRSHGSSSSSSTSKSSGKKSKYTKEHLQGLSNLQLRKLARAHNIATNLQSRGTYLQRIGIACC